MLIAVAIHTTVIYGFLIVALRAIGRPLMAQLSLIDYVIIALLGSAVESGLYLGGGSFWAGIVSAATLLLANWTLGALTSRYPGFRRMLEGVPVVLVHNGKVIEPQLHHVRVTRDDLLAAIRWQGIEDVAAVRFAVMETNGEISVISQVVHRA